MSLLAWIALGLMAGFIGSKLVNQRGHGEGYDGIGLCLENLKNIEEANVYYAMAELMGGEIATKAKARVETLFKALHNNTLIGIDKVYQKAKEPLEGWLTLPHSQNQFSPLLPIIEAMACLR